MYPLKDFRVYCIAVGIQSWFVRIQRAKSAEEAALTVVALAPNITVLHAVELMGTALWWLTFNEEAVVWSQLPDHQQRLSSVIVRASNEGDARFLASLAHGCEPAEYWLDSALTRCSLVTGEGPSEVLISRYATPASF